MKNSKAYKFFSVIDITITVIAFSLLVVITFLGVIMRYIFNNPLIWQEETQMALVLWVTFFGGSYAFREKSHIAVDLLVEAFPPALKKIAYVFIYIVVMTVLAIVMRNSYNMAMQYAATGKIISSLRIPMVYVYIGVPLGFLFMMISATFDFINDMFKKEKKGGET